MISLYTENTQPTELSPQPPSKPKKPHHNYGTHPLQVFSSSMYVND
jgi:hypothetical protein